MALTSDDLQAIGGLIETTIDNKFDEKLEPIKADITGMKGSINRLETDVTDMKTSINRIELIDENEILPRLKNIESCYTSTYDRYAKGIDQLDNLQKIS